MKQVSEMSYKELVVECKEKKINYVGKGLNDIKAMVQLARDGKVEVKETAPKKKVAKELKPKKAAVKKEMEMDGTPYKFTMRDKSEHKGKLIRIYPYPYKGKTVKYLYIAATIGGKEKKLLINPKNATKL